MFDWLENFLDFDDDGDIDTQDLQGRAHDWCDDDNDGDIDAEDAKRKVAKWALKAASKKAVGFIIKNLF